jgi:hypothetical protein
MFCENVRSDFRNIISDNMFVFEAPLASSLEKFLLAKMSTALTVGLLASASLGNAATKSGLYTYKYNCVHLLPSQGK